MSHHVALSKLNIARERLGFGKLAVKCSWYALKDATGKVRDWIIASDMKDARQALKEIRPTTPKHYTLERRGPVTAENW